MEKNEILKGTCVGYNHEGVGIIIIDNISFYIRGLLQNEKASFKVMKVNKHHGYGKLIEIIEASSERVDPPCEYYPKCGGCQLQHMSQEAQANFKTQFVKDNIRKIAHSEVEVEEVLSMDFHPYRNKAQFPVQFEQHMEIGFYRLHSNQLIDINKCMIQSDKINEVFLALKKLLPKYTETRKLRHILIKHSLKENEVMIVLIAKDKELTKNKVLIEEIEKIDESIKSIILNVNTRNDNVILGEEEILLAGKLVITEELLGLKYQISSKSFFQVNPYQTEVLYKKVLEYASLNNDSVVLDIYCGVGSISLYLAQHAKKVIGIEIVEAAVQNAKENANLNGIDNAEFVCSDAGLFAKSIATDKTEIDVVVVDPPRKGCDSTTIESIAKISPERIVYVSCNPSSLARDIKRLEALNYKCIEVQPVDMFPNTTHVETVVLMSKVNK